MVRLRSENLEGKVFNNLKVLEELGHNRVLCECLLCHNVKDFRKADVKSYKYKSCGCIKRRGL